MVTEVQGRGLRYGVELAGVAAHRLAEAREALGLYLHATLRPQTVQTVPAMATTPDEVDRGLGRFEEAVASCGAG